MVKGQDPNQRAYHPDGNVIMEGYEVRRRDVNAWSWGDWIGSGGCQKSLLGGNWCCLVLYYY